MKTEQPIVEKQGKPFLKWAGGKTQLIGNISQILPKNMSNIDTYIEPFVGSGAVMFWMLSNYKNLKRVVVNDINTDLINTYRTIQTCVEDLVKELTSLQDEYYSLSTIEEKQKMFYRVREEYNSRQQSSSISARNAALFICLNRTCFNGLYRVNAKNLFNVPFGKYKKPTICDAETLRTDSVLLQKVVLLNGDYSGVMEYITDNTFVYFDPPYKPISATSNFNSYSKDAFNDDEQIRLKEFCDRLSERGTPFVLSNSDPKSADEANDFFDVLYANYNIMRVEAKRNINSKGDGRGKINELLISNY